MQATTQIARSAGESSTPTVEVEVDTTAAQALKRARRKWGRSADAGFQVIPDVLFRCQRLLNLDAIDVVILSNITLHWWYEEDLPYPRPSVIAKRMNVSTRTIERHIEAMERKGIIKRLPSRIKNRRMIRPFDVSGLVEQLNRFAEINLYRRAL